MIAEIKSTKERNQDKDKEEEQIKWINNEEVEVLTMSQSILI
jgi:hypothetical protein